MSWGCYTAWALIGVLCLRFGWHVVEKLMA